MEEDIATIGAAPKGCALRGLCSASALEERIESRSLSRPAEDMPRACSFALPRGLREALENDLKLWLDGVEDRLHALVTSSFEHRISSLEVKVPMLEAQQGFHHSCAVELRQRVERLSDLCDTIAASRQRPMTFGAEASAPRSAKLAGHGAELSSAAEESTGALLSASELIVEAALAALPQGQPRLLGGQLLAKEQAARVSSADDLLTAESAESGRSACLPNGVAGKPFVAQTTTCRAM